MNSYGILCCGQIRYKFICPQRSYDVQGRSSTLTWDSATPEAAWGTGSAGSVGSSVPKLRYLGGNEPARGRFVLSTWGCLGLREGWRGQASDCSPGLLHGVGIRPVGSGLSASRRQEGNPALQFCLGCGKAAPIPGGVIIAWEAFPRQWPSGPGFQHCQGAR